ncbi:MAG: hypothetical protein PWR27_1477 [Petroclostridium sp.]|jgi:hypothetical protein|nr:hypothetical protein [Clostridia bacterium]MDK2810768.1 hypothetical protein [Petroclostridium sp.]
MRNEYKKMKAIIISLAVAITLVSGCESKKGLCQHNLKKSWYLLQQA